MKKRLHFVLGTVLTMMAFSSLTFASEWKQESDGRWWYQHDDGSYTTNNWELINGKYYYFDAQGWMLANTTTPDGKFVGADGALEENSLATKFSNIVNNSGITEAGQQLENEVAQKSQAYSEAFHNIINEEVQAELNRTNSASSSVSASAMSTIDLGNGVTIQTGSYTGEYCTYNVTAAKIEQGYATDKLMVKLNIEQVFSKNKFGVKRGKGIHVFFTLYDKDGFEIGHINESFGSAGEQTFTKRIEKNTARIEYRYSL